jgi:hypothetical protein
VCSARTSRLCRRPQRRREPRSRQDRIGLRLLECHCRFRHQPDTDRILFAVLHLRPRLLGRPHQHIAGRRPRHPVRDASRHRHRHCAAFEELPGGTPGIRICRTRPQRAAAAAASVLVQCRPQGAPGFRQRLRAPRRRSPQQPRSLYAAAALSGRLARRRGARCGDPAGLRLQQAGGAKYGRLAIGRTALFRLRC